jgi:hypothetical protein
LRAAVARLQARLRWPTWPMPAWWWRPSSRTSTPSAAVRELEAIVADDCILATNTSSISVTAIAAGLRLPGRVAACTSLIRCR